MRGRGWRARGGEAQDVAAAMVGGSSDKAAEGGGEARFGGVGSKAVDGPFVFGTREKESALHARSWFLFA